MMCAATAGQRGRRVLLIEHYPELGEKIRISGGGRCNFTNVNAGPANFLSRNPDFCRSALARYTPRDFIALVERHGIAYHEKKLGQLFCDGPRREIIAMLKANATRAASSGGCHAPVDGVTRDGDAFARRDAARARRRALARRRHRRPHGSRRSAPRRSVIGSPSSSACRRPAAPALVPLAFPPEALARYGDLAGVSVDAEIDVRRRALPREPAVHASRAVGPRDPADLVVLGRAGAAVIDLLPGIDADAWLVGAARVGARLDTILARRLPQRFAQQWCEAHDARAAAASSSPTSAAARARRASCSAGGAALGHARLRQGRGHAGRRRHARPVVARRWRRPRVPGLHFIGEVVDVTGWLGGYNFQWAWASGHAAGDERLILLFSTACHARCSHETPTSWSRWMRSGARFAAAACTSRTT